MRSNNSEQTSGRRRQMKDIHNYCMCVVYTLENLHRRIWLRQGTIKALGWMHVAIVLRH